MKEKIRRFIELSFEFTISSDNIYTEPNVNYITGFNSATEIRFTAGTVEMPTRLEAFKKALEYKAKKAERFEEYLQLQQDLSNYYNALKKVEGNDEVQ